MGNLLTWQKITTKAPYDLVRIYRATSEAGTYALVATQVITDNTYYDVDGTTSHWYKISFYYTAGAKESALSDAMQGGTWQGYCNLDDIRTLTNLTTSDVSDTDLCKLISYSGAQLNHDINVYLEDERISYIDEIKENDIDGVNTTFYCKKYPLGDSTNDMKVTTSDITVYSVDGEGVKTTLTVSSVVANDGKFVLATAPASDLQLYVTYKYAPLSVSDPHRLVRLACIFLAAAYAYTKVNVGKADHFKIGNISVYRDMKSFDTYYRKYLQILNQVTNRMPDMIESPDVM